MKISFRYIVFGIIICLTAIFGWQIYWLKGLYNSIEQETTRDILSSIENVDQAELSIRMDSISKESKNKKDRKMTTVRTRADNTKTTTFRTTRNAERPTDVEVVEEDSAIVKEIPENEMSSLKFDRIVKELLVTVHETIDNMALPNPNRIDSLMRVQMEKKGIKTEIYYTDIIDLKADTIVKTSRTEGFVYKKLQSFSYKYNDEGRFRYNIHIESLMVTILLRMSGILLTTFLIIIILCFAFWYLIRTVLRQRTLEEMKDDFTNNMTHELKTPIAVAFSASDALLNFNKAENKEIRERYLMICKEQLLNLSGLVEQILSLSIDKRKSFALRIEDVLMKELIDNQVELHKLKTDKEVSFSIHIDREDLTIRADRTHLNNMISNLIDNAIKYSSDNIEIIIDIQKKKNMNIIKVKDNGIGISSERQKHIFDKFYRVSSGNLHNVKGYGLGLFYVKTMTEKHGGTISVKSSPDKGTIFTIQIPDLI